MSKPTRHSSSPLTPVIFGGLVLGMLIGGTIYYLQIQKEYDLEAQKLVKEYEDKLDTEQRVKSTLIKRSNELERQLVALEEQILSDDERIISQCTSIWDTELSPSGTIVDEMKKNGFSELFTTSFFSSDTINALLSKQTANSFELCRFDKEKLGFIFYGIFEDANNIIGLFKKNPNGVDYILSYTKVFNPDSGDIGICSFVGIIPGQITENLLYRCSGGDGPYSWEKVYAFNTSTGKTITLQDCETAHDVLTCRENTFTE